MSRGPFEPGDPGAEMEHPAGRAMKFTVLFVCTGNSCRSPMAEGILKSGLPSDIVEWTLVESAGTFGLSGTPATREAIQVSREAGIDISEHRSRPLDRGLIEEVDLILAMEPLHVDWVIRTCPGAEGKVHLLAEFAAERPSARGGIIEDPIGGTLDVYRECFREISGHIDRCLPAIERLVRSKTGRTADS